MTIHSLRKNHMLFSVILLASMTAMTFHPILWNDFVTWDDGLLITGNPMIQDISWQHLKAAFTTYDPELYIPLTFLSYQLDHLVWGLHPAGFHLTNLLLHTLNAVLVFFLMRKLLGACHTEPCRSATRSDECDGSSELTMTHSLVPFFAALLWVVHPLNTEAVAWASARKDLLSGFFFLCTICAYLQYRQRNYDPSWLAGCHGEVLQSGTEEPRIHTPCSHLRVTNSWYFLSIMAFLLGLLAKVSIIMTPFVLLLIEWFHSSHPLPFKGEGRVRVLRSLLPFLLLSLIFGIVAMFGKTGNTELLSEKILIGAKATMFYVEKFLWPTGLSVLYPYTRSITWSNTDLLIPLLLVTACTMATFFFRKRSPFLLFGWAFFLLMLLPSFTNFAKGHDQLRDVYFASDRYAYLPSIGIFLLIGYGFSLSHWERVRVRGLRVALFCVPLLAPLSFLSFRQSHVWHNTETLFQNVSEQYPDSHIAWNNLGSIALERGDETMAFENYDRSLAIRPNAAAFFNLGQIALRKGLTAEAMELYRRAIASRPNDTDSLLNLGVLYLRTGDSTTAADLFRRAIAFENRLAIAHFNLGLALEARKDLDGARKAFANTLALDPNDQEAQEHLRKLESMP